jgi:hypothetical protein
LNVCNAAFAADRRCQLTGNPIDFQSPVVHDRLLTTHSGTAGHAIQLRNAVVRRYRHQRRGVYRGRSRGLQTSAADRLHKSSDDLTKWVVQ